MSRIAKGTAAAPSGLGLRKIALLQGLSAEALDALARQCAWRHFDADQQIISREAADRDVYLIVSGRIRVTTYSAGGRQVTFRDASAGEYFGELAAIDDLPRSADVVALESTLLASMSPALFRNLLRNEPTVTERILLQLASLVRSLSERVIDLSTLGVQHRIHAELLRLARDAGIKGNKARLDPTPKHAEIASRVSTYREQVTREISALARLGLVARDGRALIVLDVRRLEQMVGIIRESV